jgi:hypothetical protein
MPSDGTDWRTELSSQLAGRFFPQSTEEDRKAALGQGIGRFGSALKMASIQGSWTKAAPFLMGAYSAGVDEYRNSLKEIIDARMKTEDRAYQEEQRAVQRETQGEEREKRGRERAFREAAPSQIGNLRSQFEKTIVDTDIDENERATFQSSFDAEVTAFENDPSPENQRKILDVIAKAAAAAGETEKFQEGMSQDKQKAADALGLSVDEYVTRYLPAKLKDEEIERAEKLRQIREAGASRAEAAETRTDASRKRARTKKYDEIVDAQFEALQRGEVTTTPSGLEMLPVVPGITYRQPPASYNVDSKRRDALLANKDFREFMASPEQAQSIDESVAGMIRGAFPDVEIVEDESGLLSISAEDWAAVVKTLQNPVSAAKSSGPAKKLISRAKVEAAAKKNGLSIEQAIAEAQDAGYEVTP